MPTSYLPSGSTALNAGSGFKNRIINGAMVIDQRSNGAITATGGPYVVDRFQTYVTSGTITRQQSSNAPAGFTKSVNYTVTSPGTRNAGDAFLIQQWIEGYSIADMNMGTPAAATITLSFWVKSSIQGLYSGSINSSDNTRVYPFNYTINFPNVWEQKAITLVGDITGASSWYNDNRAGLLVRLDLGSGTSYQGTANSWQVFPNATGTAGTVSWATTAGATFYVTGIQLEKNSGATSFEYRQYTTELQLCQRWYWQMGPYTSGSGQYDGLAYVFAQGAVWTNSWHAYVQFPVTMRAIPSLICSAASTFAYHCAGISYYPLTSVAAQATVISARLYGGTTWTTNTGGSAMQVTVASPSQTAFLAFSAEF